MHRWRNRDLQTVFLPLACRCRPDPGKDGHHEPPADPGGQRRPLDAMIANLNGPPALGRDAPAERSGPPEVIRQPRRTCHH